MFKQNLLVWIYYTYRRKQLMNVNSTSSYILFFNAGRQLKYIGIMSTRKSLNPTFLLYWIPVPPPHPLLSRTAWIHCMSVLKWISYKSTWVTPSMLTAMCMQCILLLIYTGIKIVLAVVPFSNTYIFLNCILF